MSGGGTPASGREGHTPLVLHVVPTPTPRGAQREARALADQLDEPGRRRHRVLCLFDGPPGITPDIELGLRGGPDPASGFDPRAIRGLRRALGDLRPAVVVAHGSDPLKYLVPAALGLPAALVYYAIGVYAGNRDRATQLALWRWLARRATVVAACGNDVHDECIELLHVPRARVQTVSNGRDPEVFHPAPAAGTGDPRLVFVGALTDTKRPERFVALVQALRDQGVPLHAQLIGDGPLRQDLQAPAARAGVEVLGARSDVPALLAAADLLIFPSVPAGEGMPGVLIEAGLCGVPVVTTDVPGVGTIVRRDETGLVVGVDDFGALVEATRRLVDDAALRAAMGHAARDYCVEHFSMAAVGRRWLEVLSPYLPAR